MANDHTASIEKGYRLDGLPEYISGVVRDEVKKALASGEANLVNRSQVLVAVRGRLRSVLDTSLSEEVNRQLDTIYDEIEQQTGGLIRDGKIDTAFIERFSDAVGRETTSVVRGGLDYILKGELPPELISALNEGPDRLEEYLKTAQEYLPGEQLAGLKNKILSKPLLTIPNEVYGGLLATSASRHFALAYKGVTVDEYELQRGIEVTKVLVWQLKNKEGLSLTVGDFVSFVGKMKTELGLDSIGWVAAIDGKIDQLSDEFKKIEASLSQLDAVIIEGGMSAVNETRGLVTEIENQLGNVREKVFGPLLQAGREIGEEMAFLGDGLPRNFDDIIERAGMSGTTFDRLAHVNIYDGLNGLLEEKMDEVNAMIADAAAEIAGNVTSEAVNLIKRSKILDSEKIPKQNPSLGGPYDPVLLHNGEFYHAVTDLMIPGKMIDYEFKRIYRSRSDFSGPLGHNWTHNYDERLYFRSDGVTYVDYDGKKYFFAKRLCRNCNFCHSEGGTTEACPADRREARACPLASFGGRQAADRREAGESPVPRRFNGRSFASLRMTDNCDTVSTCEGKANCYVSPQGQFSELVAAGLRQGNGFVLRERHGVERRFRADGRLVTISDRFGNMLRFIYDDKGRLSRVIDTLNREVSYYYNDEGLLEAVEDFIGRKIRFEYDDNSDLVRATLPATEDFPYGKTTQYRYSNGNSDDTLNHNLEEITDPKGQRYLMNVYSNEGFSKDMVVGQIYGDPKYLMRAGYRPLSVPWVAILDADSFNRPVQRADVSDRSFVRHFYIHNAAGNLLKEGYFDASGREVVTDEHRYNREGLRISTRSQDGLVAQRVFDESNQDRLNQANLLSVKYVPAGGLAPREFKYSYTERFQLPREKIDSGGLVTQHVYDLDEKGNAGKGTLTIIKQGAAVTRFRSDRFGRVIEVVDPRGVRNKYEYSRYLDRIVRDDGQASGKTGVKGKRGVEERGGIEGPPAQSETRYIYDEVGNRIQVVDANGAKWIFRVNRLNQVTQALAPQPLNYVKHYRYDANNNIIEEAVSSPDGMQIKYSYSYDILDHVTFMQMSGGGLHAERLFSYDPEERAASVIEPEGEKTSYFYNEAGRLDKVIIHSAGSDCRYLPHPTSPYKGEELPLLCKEGKGEVDHKTKSANIYNAKYKSDDTQMRRTQYIYDDKGRLSQLVDGEDNATTYQYNGFGEESAVLKSDGLKLTFERDLSGRIKAVRALDSGGALLEETLLGYDVYGRLIERQRSLSGEAEADKKNPIENFQYNAAGDLASYVDPAGRTFQYHYDGLRRLASIDAPLGNRIEYKYDKIGNVLERRIGGLVAGYEYDAMRRMVSERRPNGTKKEWRYGVLNQPLSIAEDGFGATVYEYDGLGRPAITSQRAGDDVFETRYEWDRSGRLLGITDPNGKETAYAYDTLDRLVALMRFDGGIKKFEYNKTDRLTLLRDVSGNSIHNQYDSVGRLIERRIDRAEGVQGTTIQRFSYDLLGRLISSFDNNDPDDSTDDSRIYYYYDPLSRQTAERQNSVWWSKTFDASNQAIAIANSGAVTVSRRFDPLNRITQVTSGDGLSGEWKYPSFGPEVSRSFSNGVREENNYDLALRLESASYKGESAGDLPDTRYIYNDAGHLGEKITDRREVYNYDAMGRLIGCRQCSQETGGKTVFDPDGNQLKLNDLLLSYDALNRLISVRSSGGGKMAAYAYDVHDRRISKTLAASRNKRKIEYLYDGWDLLATYDAGHIMQQYFNKDPLSSPFAVSEYGRGDATTFFLHVDRLGSVVAVTDDDGEVVERRDYAPYGELTDGSRNKSFYDFTGAIHDAESGLLYFRHRYYDATTGRFLTQDPLGYKNQFGYKSAWPAKVGRIYGPQRRYTGNDSWNNAVSQLALPEMDLYLYARANPLFWTDPLGLKIIVNGNREDFDDAREYLIQSPQAAEVFHDLESSRRTIEVVTSGRYSESNYNPSSRTVQWNPSGGSVAQTYGVQSPAVGLIHELAHARNDIRGVLQSDQPTGDAYHTVEERNVIQGVELNVAQELGEPSRTDHASTSIVVPGVMYHELWFDGSYDGEDDYRRKFETIPSTQSIYFSGQPELFMTQPLLPKKG